MGKDEQTLPAGPLSCLRMSTISIIMHHTFLVGSVGRVSHCSVLRLSIL